MEKNYAFGAKLIALWSGLIVFGIFILMIYPILQTPKSKEIPFVCGNQFTSTSYGKEAQKGKVLFIENCTQCHAKNMKDKLTGPALADWRIYFRNEKEVVKFINNSKMYKKSNKNKPLKDLLREFEPSECTPFPTLTEEDVVSIFKYVDAVYR